MPTFDPQNLLIILDTPVGTVEDISVINDLYSYWKEWVLSTPQNQGYPPAFRTIGGDALSTVIDAGAYFFLRNDFGWRIRPAEKDADYYISGNLVVEDSTKPATVPTLGGYTTSLIGLQPVTQGLTNEIGVSISTIEANTETTIDILCNNGSIEVSASGHPVNSKLITIFEDDMVTIKAQLLISADGLTRTRIV